MHKTAKIVIRAAKPLGLAVLTIAALVACGQTGPLYLPDDEKSSAPPPDAAAADAGVLTAPAADGTQ